MYMYIYLCICMKHIVDNKIYTIMKYMQKSLFSTFKNDFPPTVLELKL